MTSMSETLVDSHDEVGEMVVGRVSVDVSIYEIVPRSNCAVTLDVVCLLRHAGTYIYAAGQPL